MGFFLEVIVLLLFFFSLWGPLQGPWGPLCFPMLYAPVLARGARLPGQRGDHSEQLLCPAPRPRRPPQS